MRWQPVIAGLNVCGFVLILALSAVSQSPSTTAQADEQTPGVPKFHAESRQVLVEANVWNPGAEKHATNLLSKPGQQVPRGWPTPAGGLTVKDFHVFDNSVEQKINFLKELDFDTRWSYPWWMEPDSHGTWGIYDLWPYWGEDSTATYLIGYAPPSLQPGECRTVSVVVKGHDVDLNRTQYCSPKLAGDLQAEATAAKSQMQALTNSHVRRPTKLSIQVFSFWSSGVLRLLTETPSQSGGSVEPESDYTYVVQVHDAKVPATVQIAADFQWREKEWEANYCFKKNPSVLIYGAVYKANGELETQFKDNISCPNPSVMQSTIGKYAAKHGWFGNTLIPTRFDTQVELRPGDYELRVLVTDGSSIGQAQIPLHVEAFDGHQLAISDIVMAGIVRDASSVPREAASVYPAPIIPTPLVSKGVQFFPSTDNHMSRQAPVSLYFEIYEPLLSSQPAAVSFSVKITDLKTNSLVMNTGPMSAANWVLPGNAVIPVGLKLNIEKLKPGFYRLEVQASDSRGRETEWRTTKFNIQ
ncbi:MAG: hypothetical protein WA655_08625 [Candidatus Korobacteraceae bacterium]